MTNRQVYCSVDDLLSDLGLPGAGDNVLEKYILPASQYILQEIGPFLPVQETRTRAGNNKKVLFVDPVLSVSAISNDETALATTDYQLEPSTRMWQDGPFVRISVDLDTSAVGYWVPESDAVQISGKWGLFERSKTTGATLASEQLIGATSLVVGDGSLLSPGMVLLLESEWQFINGYGALTANATTLASALDGSSETLSLASGAAVKIGEIIKVDFEQMRILDIQSNSAFVERGWNKTKKAAHLISAGVGVYRTFTVERGVNGSSPAGHASGTAISQMVAPDDVNYLCRQIAALMMKKSQTGYAGRAGSPETGESFYTHEFPRDVIARIKSNYYIPK